MAFRIAEHNGGVHQLPRKYRYTPMSLADAGIVPMAEIHRLSVQTSRSIESTVEYRFY